MKVKTVSVGALINSGEAFDCPLPLDIIPNRMSINLNSVEAITWVRQDDGQLISVQIHFSPAEVAPKE